MIQVTENVTDAIFYAHASDEDDPTAAMQAEPASARRISCAVAALLETEENVTTPEAPHPQAPTRRCAVSTGWLAVAQLRHQNAYPSPCPTRAG